MKLVCISDTHGMHDRIKSMPKGDILCFAGDFTNIGSKTDIIRFGEWLSRQKYKYKIICAGNHDWGIFWKRQKAQEWLTQKDNSIFYLQDETITINGINFYVSPFTPTFCDWAFMLDRGLPLQKKWAQIPKDTDVLITHGPPKGILDPDINGNSVGDLDLLARVRMLNLKAHIFGHLHEGYGVLNSMGTKFINASICNDKYQPINNPIVVEI